MSWGYKIASAYIAFVVFMGSLVYMSTQKKIDLVETNYYEQELAYQNIIDAGKNQAALSAPIVLAVNAQAITLNFPSEFTNQSINGAVTFYSPVNNNWDRKFPINQLQELVMTIPRDQLQRSQYVAKVNWEVGGKQYFQASNIDLN